MRELRNMFCFCFLATVFSWSVVLCARAESEVRDDTQVDDKDGVWQDLLSFNTSRFSGFANGTDDEDYLDLNGLFVNEEVGSFSGSGEAGLNDDAFVFNAREFDSREAWDSLVNTRGHLTSHNESSSASLDADSRNTLESLPLVLEDWSDRSMTAVTIEDEQADELPVRGSSLAFVFDSTGSMHDELSQVKVGAAKILEALRNNSDIPIHNYVLIPFHDPAIGPVTVTTDHKVFKERIEDISVFGGGDCPEMSVGAIKKALEVSLPKSYIYVFTDAAAKDYKLQNEVLSLIQRRQAHVDFITTGDCGNVNDENYKVYREIATTSSGQVYRLSKSEVKEVLKYVKVALQTDVVNLLSQNKPAPAHNVPDEHQVVIDNTLKEFTVSVSGKNATITVTDPKGKSVDGPPQLEPLLTLDNVKIVNVKEPDPGPWKVHINSDSDYTVRSTGLSGVHFNHGFSTVETNNLVETNHRPLTGAMCYLLIQTSDFDRVYNLTSVDIVGLNGEVLQQVLLEEVPGQPGVYRGGGFMPPPTYFHLGISGFGNDGFPIKRITTTAISSQLPEKPIISMRPKTTGWVNKPGVLKCHVQSVVPFVVQWFKDGHHFGDQQNYSQTCEVVLELKKLVLHSQGNYTCRASNVAGVAVRGTYLTVTGDPPSVNVTGRIVASVGDTVFLHCSVHSTLQYNVEWSQFTAKNAHSGIVHKVSKGKELKNNTLMIADVSPDDEGWYLCVATNKGGRGEGRSFLLVKHPLRVEVEPSSVSYVTGDTLRVSCRARGRPLPTVEWRRDQITITDEDPSVSIESIGEKLYLVIDYLEKSNEGFYTCVAANSEESITAVLELVYTEKPTIVAKENNVMVKVGTDAVLKCSATGEPKPTVKWFRGENQILSDFRYKIEDGSMTIESVKSTDAGEFSCVGENQAGTNSDFIGLFVGTPPTFIQKPRDKKIQIYHNGTIPCSAVAMPPPEMKWSRVNVTALDRSRMFISSGGALRITNMQLSDAGRYVCSAQNVFGSVSSEVLIGVTGVEKPAVDKNVVLTDVTALAGDVMTIPCGLVLGHPPGVVRWYRDGMEVANSLLRINDSRAFVDDAGNLVLMEVTGRDQGDYLCSVQNVAGNTSRPYKLSISESPKITKDETSELKATQGGEIVIPCPVEGSPTPTISWMKDGLPLPMTHTVFQREDGSLIIRNLTLENSGTYICTAVNEIGSVSKAIGVHIQAPPTILEEGIRDNSVNIVEGHVVVLNCHVTAVPVPTITWYKDNMSLAEREGKIQLQPEVLRFIATVDDSGIYKCVAVNDVGSTFKEFNVTILVPPNIVDREEEVSMKARAGQPITLQCHVRGFPRPTILWQRNGMYLTQNTSDVTILDSGLLVIKNVSKESAGTYVCDAENLAGITQRIYYLQVNFAPKIIEEVNVTFPIKLREGEEYSLPCLVEGNPKPVVTWRKNGFPILETENDLVILGDNTLVFLQITRDATGRYRCEAHNAEGLVHRDFDIEVYAPPSMIAEDFPTKLEVNEGDSIVLTCPTSSAVPTPYIQWVKDAVPLNHLLLERSDEAQMKLSDDQRTLTIVEAHPVDNGNYSCVATNLAGRTDAKFVVDVLMTPHFEEFNHIAHRTVLAGGEITLNCSVSGNPLPRVTWRKGSSPINAQNMPGVHVTLDKQHLIIRNSRTQHSGTYICTAANKVSTKEREFYVTVLESPSFTGPSEETVDLMVGEKLKLHCSVSGVPEPEIIWRKQGPDKKRLDTKTKELTIEKVDCSDGGTYICEVTNPAGTKTKTFFVTVLEPPSIEAHNVTDEVNVPEGGNVTLKCKTKGQPKPDVTWLHNGQVLRDTTRSKREASAVFPGDFNLSEDGWATLNLANVSESSKGVYTVLATNKAGVVEKHYQVKVLVPPRLKDTSGAEEMSVLRPLPVLLQCHVKGNPPPKIQWYHNGQILPDGLEHIEQSGQDLYIKHSKAQHSGNYTCRAENPAGNTTRDFQVTVIEPPRLLHTDNTSKQHVINDELTLKCMAEGHPTPTVLWLHSSSPVANASGCSIRDGGTTLVIENLRLEDSGWYSCVVTNLGGAVERNFHVEVHEPPVLSDQSTQDVPHKKVNLHRGFSLHCAFESRPPPVITWLKDGQPINEFHRLQTHSDGAFLTSLVAGPEDVGNYKCIAENIAGTQELNFKVDVIVPAIWSAWSDWSECSVSCGVGQQLRQRYCDFGLKELDPRLQVDKSKCEGEDVHKRSCQLVECQIHGGWSSWGSWSACSQTCGKATRRRHRACDHPTPEHGGKPCEGADSEEEICPVRPCPVDGQWSAWSEWSECSEHCSGTRRRTRKCDNPEPQFGGEDCQGRSLEVSTCRCPGHGRWQPWSEWSPCSASCGRGHRKRHRTCKATRRGKFCKGENLQIEKCFVRHCHQNDLPRAASLRVRGQLNGKPLDDRIKANIISLREERLVSIDDMDALSQQKTWFPYSPFLLSPVSWNTAYETDDADNGYSLTNGRFFSQSDIEFVTGEGLRVKHEGQGVDSQGELLVQVEVIGEVPIVEPHASVLIKSLDQDFVQTGTNSLYSSVQNDAGVEGGNLAFTWNSSIYYDDQRGTMPYLVETLSMKDIYNVYDPQNKNVSYAVSSKIKKKFEDNKCPPGFLHDVEHMHCRDKDECEDPNTCSKQQTCENTFGAFTCSCSNGYVSSGTDACIDVDECRRRTPVCSHSCVNTDGSYRCFCPSGYSLESDQSTCVEDSYFIADEQYEDQTDSNDVKNHEPNPRNHTLSHRMFQSRSKQSRREDDWYDEESSEDDERHLCLPGYFPVNFECKDFNECADASNICDDDEICLNTRGSYQCLSTPCPLGFDRLYPSKNCMRRCNGDSSRCPKHALISETVMFHTVTLSDVMPLQDILLLDVMGESGVRVVRTRFRVVESGELFRVRVTHGRGSLYALRNLRADTLYRVKAEALLFGAGDLLLYSTDFVIFISLAD